MGTLTLYILEWAFGLILMLAAYKLLLGGTTFHRFNRMVLLGIPPLLIHFHYPLQISSAGWALAVRHTRQPMQRATSRATPAKMAGQSHRGIST